MFNSISGSITTILPNQIYLKMDAIEWAILMPATAIEHYHQDQEVKIYTWIHQWQDGMNLYGFYSVKQRELFFSLIKVNGIGPKQALRILSASNEDHLIDAIESGNTLTLSSVPGIGAKTAAKIILALKGKFDMDTEVDLQSSLQELAVALSDMGFNRKKAESVLIGLNRELEKNLQGEALEKEIFRRAIIELSC